MEGFTPDRFEKVINNVAEDVARMCGNFAMRVLVAGGVLLGTTNCSLFSDLDGLRLCDADKEGNEAGQTCAVEIGNCVEVGIFSCQQNDDGLLICMNPETKTPIPTEAPAELCDGADNDCDGLIDEGIEGIEHLGNVCVAGFRADNIDCLGEGTYQCSPSGEAVYCEGVYNNEMPGVCDADKDGVIDPSYEKSFVHVGNGEYISRYPVSMCNESLCVTPDLKPIEVSMESGDLKELVERDLGEGVNLSEGELYDSLCERFDLPDPNLEECIEYAEGATPADAPNCVGVDADGNFIYGAGITPEQLKDGNVFIGCEGNGLISDNPAYFRVSISSNPQ